MELEIKVDPEKINKYMAEKLIESAIGDVLNKAIRKHMGDYELDKTVNQAIQSLMKICIEELLLENKMKEKLQDAFVAKFLATGKLDTLIDTFISNISYRTY